MNVIRKESTARGIILQGNALLVCQGMGESFVHLPGGHLEAGETPADALRRELQEEAGIIARSMSALGILHTRWPRFDIARGFVEVHETLHLYRVNALIPANHRGEYHLSCRWVMVSPVLYDQLKPLEAIAYIMQEHEGRTHV